MNWQEAIKFYQSALGAEVDMMMRFDESPDPLPPEMMRPGYEERIMHASFRVGGSSIMASDGCGEAHPMEGFSLSITVADAAEANRMFEALAAGGEVKMPLGETFWSPRFGMCADKFGVAWMVGVEAQNPCTQ